MKQEKSPKFTEVVEHLKHFYKEASGDKDDDITPFNMEEGIKQLIDFLQSRIKTEVYRNKKNRKCDRLLLKWIKSQKRFYGWCPDPYLFVVVQRFLKTYKKEFESE